MQIPWCKILVVLFSPMLYHALRLSVTWEKPKINVKLPKVTNINVIGLCKIK